MKNEKRVRKTHTTNRAKIQSESQSKRFGRWQYIDDFEKEIVVLVHSDDLRFRLCKDAGLNLWLWDIGTGRGKSQSITAQDYEQACQFLMSPVVNIAPHTPEKFLRLHGILPPAASAVPARAEAGPVAAMPLDDKPTITEYCLSLSSLALDDEVAQIAVSAAEVEALQRRFSFPGQSPLNQALRVAVHRALHDVPWQELETAKTEANGLLELLCDKLDHITLCGSDFSGPNAESIVAGIAIMVRAAQSHLQTAFQGILAASNPRHDQAAPLANAA